MPTRHSSINVASIIAVTSLLASCGGGSGGSGTSAGTGTLNVALTDAPVDGVEQVVVSFTGVTLKPSGGPAFDITFDTPRIVDLKALNAGNTESLLDGEEVPAGDYNWMRLHVDAEFDTVFDSYVVEEGGGQVELRVPSGENSGLKLVSGFTVVAGGESSFVIDWNLRSGLVKPPGQAGYKLQPALRIIDLQAWGTIAGTVSASLLTDPSCTSDPNTGEGNAVYIFPEAVTPDDLDGIDPDPLTIAEVRLDAGTGNQEYRAPFLEPGAYTVAFTCQAADDHVPDDEDPVDADDPIVFTMGDVAVVTDGLTTIVDF